MRPRLKQTIMPHMNDVNGLSVACLLSENGADSVSFGRSLLPSFQAMMLGGPVICEESTMEIVSAKYHVGKRINAPRAFCKLNCNGLDLELFVTLILLNELSCGCAMTAIFASLSG